MCLSSKFDERSKHQKPFWHSIRKSLIHSTEHKLYTYFFFKLETRFTSVAKISSLTILLISTKSTTCRYWWYENKLIKYLQKFSNKNTKMKKMLMHIKYFVCDGAQNQNEISIHPIMNLLDNLCIDESLTILLLYLYSISTIFPYINWIFLFNKLIFRYWDTHI